MKKKIYLIAYTLLCAISSYSQSLSFNLPFIPKNAEPELFFLDPNYDRNNKLDYYSLGSLIKVKYEYDSKHRPINKKLFVMDRYDRPLTPMMETTYEYDKKARLVSERTAMLYNNKPIYEMLITTAYGRNNTDTIRTSINWLDSRYKSQLDIPLQNTVTINYRNQYNLPDSTVQIIDDGWAAYSDHLYYTYNSKQQLIHCDAFKCFMNKSDDDTQPVKIYSYDVKYNKNKVEYIQTGTVADFEDHDTYDYYRGINNFKTKEEVMRYTISTDNNNRIIAKQFLVDQDTILNSTYSYRANGESKLETKLALTRNFLNNYGFSGMGGSMNQMLKEFSELSYEVLNEANAQTSTYYMKNEKRGEIIISSYPDKKLKSVEELKYYEKELDSHNKVDYKYLEDGLTEKVTYRKDYDSADLEPYRKYLYRKDANDKTTYEEIFSYDSQEKQWEPSEKSIQEFDQYGYRSHYEYYEYDYNYNMYDNEPKTKSLQGKTWESIVYNEKKEPLEEISKTWVNGEWVNDALKKYAYTSDGEKAMSENYDWDSSKNDWIGRYKDSVFYNPQENLKGDISYKWLDDEMKWIPTEKREIVKIENDETSKFYSQEKRTYFSWLDDKWKPTEEYVSNEGYNTYFKSYSQWDEEAQDWSVREKEIREVDDANIKYDISYAWDGDVNQLVGVNNTTYIRNNLNDNEQIIYKVWDPILQIWKDKATCHLVYGKGTYAFIYELYNEKNKSWEYWKKIEGAFLGENEESSMDILSFWDIKDNKWKQNMKASYRNNDKLLEIYTYNESKKLWQPLYYINERRQDKEYKKWNNKQKDWENFILKKSGWYDEYYLWDSKQQEFIEKDEYEIESMEEDVLQKISEITIYTSYDKVINSLGN